MALICCALRGPRFTGSGPPPSVQRTGLLSGWEEAALWWEKINPPLTSGRTPARGDASGTFAGRWEGEKGRVQFASSRSVGRMGETDESAFIDAFIHFFFSLATNRKSKAEKRKSVTTHKLSSKKKCSTLSVSQDTFSSSLSFTGGCRASSILHRKDHHHHQSVSLGNCRCISLATSFLPLDSIIWGHWNTQQRMLHSKTLGADLKSLPVPEENRLKSIWNMNWRGRHERAQREGKPTRQDMMRHDSFSEAETDCVFWKGSSCTGSQERSWSWGVEDFRAVNM